MLADVCAYTTALLHMNMSVLRMAATQPSKSIFSIHLGSEHWLFNLGFISTIYQTSALLLLLAIALSTWTAAAAAAGRRREPFYTRHRHALCLMSRLLRLFYCMAHLLQPGAMSFFAHAIAARTRDVQQRPMKALLVNVLHPTAFWMAQVRCWRAVQASVCFLQANVSCKPGHVSCKCVLSTGRSSFQFGAGASSCLSSGTLTAYWVTLDMPHCRVTPPQLSPRASALYFFACRPTSYCLGDGCC